MIVNDNDKLVLNTWYVGDYQTSILSKIKYIHIVTIYNIYEQKC